MASKLNFLTNQVPSPLSFLNFMSSILKKIHQWPFLLRAMLWRRNHQKQYSHLLLASGKCTLNILGAVYMHHSRYARSKRFYRLQFCLKSHQKKPIKHTLFVSK